MQRSFDKSDINPIQDPSRKLEEPIAALSSGSGPGAIAVIRVSGKSCHEIFRSVIQPLTNRPFIPSQLRRCRIADPRSGELLDEAMAVFFNGPKSYTGQDSIEVFCHGGPFVINSILNLFFRHGARPAEPGEFTRRAFLNGKLDLTAAEGIGELVGAQSHQQWIAARYLAGGHLGKEINQLRDKLIDALAHLEALIDFPEEDDVQQVHRKTVREKVSHVALKVEGLIGSYKGGRIASQGLKVALVGEPNVGKSTLLNELLGRERAIVTEVAGTTRDYIEESCLINGRLIRLVDTAGLRNTDEIVEKIGIRASLQIIGEADLVLVLIEATSIEYQMERLEGFFNGIDQKNLRYLVTKKDLCADLILPNGWSGVSVKTSEGLDSLREFLARSVDEHVHLLKEACFVTNARHLQSLQKAMDGLVNFCQADDQGAFEECLGFELQSAVRDLASIVGDVGAEDVLDRIFQKFCIGK